MDAIAGLLARVDWPVVVDFAAAALLGGVVSSGELIARYTDKPWHTIRTPPALFYMFVNAVASVSALALIRALGWNFGAAGEASRMLQIAVAGFGAMAIFRSAFFTVRVGDEDVGVGASSFLQVLLNAADKEVDRRRAGLRAEAAKTIMEGLSFERALISLPTYATELMQNLPKEEKDRLLDDAIALKQFKHMDDETKLQLLGLVIINYLGEDVLGGAVNSLRRQLQAAGAVNAEAERKKEERPLPSLLRRIGGRPKAEETAEHRPGREATAAGKANSGLVDLQAEEEAGLPELDMDKISSLLAEQEEPPAEGEAGAASDKIGNGLTDLDFDKVTDLLQEELKQQKPKT